MSAVELVLSDSATAHYSAAVAVEVIAAVPARRCAGRPGLIYMWIAPSDAAAAETANRPRGRTGPIEMCVYAEQVAERRFFVFHCYRTRAKDRTLWAESGKGG